jgi:hypothetical protein
MGSPAFLCKKKGAAMKTTFSAIRKRVYLWGLLLFLISMLAACTGGGGGGDVDVDKPFSGGDGTGTDGITVFWRYFGDIGGGNAVAQTEDGGFVFAGEKGSDFDFSTKNLYHSCSVHSGSISQFFLQPWEFHDDQV